jgi:hypothetical protein
MWLLHSIQLKLEAFFDAAIPPYAILSHRWGSDEISFQELQTVTEGRLMRWLLTSLMLGLLKFRRRESLRGGNVSIGCGLIRAASRNVRPSLRPNVLLPSPYDLLRSADGGQNTRY